MNFYNDQLKNQKIDGKSLATLWVSKDAKERELARQASEVIITLILEQNFLIEDKMGKIIRIAGNGKWLHYDPSLPKNEQKFMEKKIQEILSQLSLPSVIDSEKIQKLLQPQSIQELTPLETGITTQIPLLQKQIESTMSEVVWQGKRGNISYHPDTSTLSSREHAVKVEMKAEKFYLEGLDVELTLEEVVWLANFRNWVKYKYSKETVAFETERMRDALVLK